MLLSTPELRVQMLFKPLEVLALLLSAAGIAIIPAISAVRKRRFSARTASVSGGMMGSDGGSDSKAGDDTAPAPASGSEAARDKKTPRRRQHRRRTVWMAGNGVAGQSTSSLDAFVAVFESTHRGQMLAALGKRRSGALLKWVRALCASKCPDPLDWVASSDRLSASRGRMRGRSSRRRPDKGLVSVSAGGRSLSGLEGAGKAGEGGHSMRTARREARR